MKLNPSNPYHDPIIQPNYFEEPQDIVDLREAIKMAREIFSQKAFDQYKGPEIGPGKFQLCCKGKLLGGGVHR